MRFQAERAKYSNFYITITTVAILTKFWTVIKTAKYYFQSSQNAPTNPRWWMIALSDPLVNRKITIFQKLFGQF